MRGSLARGGREGNRSKGLDTPPIRRDNAIMSPARHIRAIARRGFGRATRVAAVIALLAVAANSPARATAMPEATPSSLAPMRFVRVRSSDTACQPNCPEWISAEGKIVTGSADALDRVVGALDGRRLPIFINSAGGSVQDGMAMGRLIRARHLAVAVAHTAIAPCPASVASCGEARGVARTAGAYCASACTLVLAGGVERYVSPLSFVGVHQLVEVVSKTTFKRSYKVRYFRFAWFKWELSRKLVHVRRSTATIKRPADRIVDDDVADYFAEMGVGERVMALTLATPPRLVHWLTPEELASTRLATVRVMGPSPIVEGDGPSGLGGEPIDARSGAESLFVARGASPPSSGTDEIETAFAYRRGGGAVQATLVARGAARPAVSGLLLTLYSHDARSRGAQFRVDGGATGKPARVAIPVDNFCELAHGGRAVVSLIERPQDAANPSALVGLPLTGDAKPLFDEVCTRVASVATQ
jgi:hypothetical protein